jgi:hypothetical protein
LPQSYAAAGLRHSRGPFITTKVLGSRRLVICYFLPRIDADFSQQFELSKNEMLPDRSDRPRKP